jgi:hypothetical protein
VTPPYVQPLEKDLGKNFFDFHEKIQDEHKNLLVHGKFKHKKCTASQQPHSKVVSSN